VEHALEEAVGRCRVGGRVKTTSLSLGFEGREEFFKKLVGDFVHHLVVGAIVGCEGNAFDRRRLGCIARSGGASATGGGASLPFFKGKTAAAGLATGADGHGIGHAG
jgi:hypothetical protein